MKIEQIEFDYIIDSITSIFDNAPRVAADYMCHDEDHSLFVPDVKIRNKNLKEFMQKYFDIKEESKVKLFGENIKDAIRTIKEFKEPEPPHIPKHGILRRGMF